MFHYCNTIQIFDYITIFYSMLNKTSVYERELPLKWNHISHIFLTSVHHVDFDIQIQIHVLLIVHTDIIQYHISLYDIKW
jgi:hypothetical protein